MKTDIATIAQVRTRLKRTREPRSEAKESMETLKIKLPMKASELETLLHRVCDNGHWDICMVVADSDDKESGEEEAA